MYNIYPSLLDRYTDYIRANDTWEQFWGHSDAPKVSPEEYEHKQLAAFIDSVNRVPFVSEPANKGTCFNELVDCMLKGSAHSGIMEIGKVGELYHCKHLGSGMGFDFHPGIIKRLFHRYRGALPQVLVEAPLGDVRLYGYIDELLPFAIHDIKTTSKWELGKFRNHAQHLVYTYCVRYMGGDCDQFHYDVVQWGKEPGQEEFNVESYMWTHESLPKLQELVNGCVSLINQYRPLITDKRVFGGSNPADYSAWPLEKWLLAPSEEARDLYKDIFNTDLICK